jgi:hypothetical protein
MKCLHCQEEIVAGDPILPFNNGEVAMHRACGLRSIIGSVAHQMKTCSCFVCGSSDGDPEGMTRREAAEAALSLWETTARLRRTAREEEEA